MAVSDCCSERPAKSVLNAPGSTTMTLMPRGPTLLAERVRHPLQGKFCGGVVTGARRCEAAGDRGDVDDRPTAACPHAGQHCLDQRHRSEEIGGEQLVYVVFVRFLHGGSIPMASVVDEHV